MKKNILTAFFLSLVSVSHAQSTLLHHKVGERWGGGIVFVVVDAGRHGLIAETQDQGISEWSFAKMLISNGFNHSDSGKVFTDWRLPEKSELNLLYYQKDIVGGFANDFIYWSSHDVEGNLTFAWAQYFSADKKGLQDLLSKDNKLRVRAVRVF